MIKSLRSAIAGMFVILCVGTLLLWPITSHRNFELFNNVTEWELYCAASWNGKLRVRHSNNLRKAIELNQWKFWSIDDDRMKNDYAQYTREWNSGLFDASWDADQVSLSLPHIGWAALMALAAYAIKPKPKFQFSFQDLLMLTALLAIIFGGFTLTSHLAKSANSGR